jgi:hypothetical protein
VSGFSEQTDRKGPTVPGMAEFLQRRPESPESRCDTAFSALAQSSFSVDSVLNWIATSLSFDRSFQSIQRS